MRDDFEASGRVTAGHIYWDMTGTGGDFSISSGSVVDGNFLGPQRSFLVDNATVNGRIIGGGGAIDKESDTLSIHSSSTINAPPSVVPLPRSIMAGLALMGGLGLSKLTRPRREWGHSGHS